MKSVGIGTRHFLKGIALRQMFVYAAIVDRDALRVKHGYGLLDAADMVVLDKRFPFFFVWIIKRPELRRARCSLLNLTLLTSAKPLAPFFKAKGKHHVEK